MPAMLWNTGILLQEFKKHSHVPQDWVMLGIFTIQGEGAPKERNFYVIGGPKSYFNLTSSVGTIIL